MSVFVGGAVFANACGLSIPGTSVTIGEPGLKPSSRFQSVGSIGTPETFAGVASGLMSSRSPVDAEGSGWVKKSFGHGRRHSEGSSGSQPAVDAASALGGAHTKTRIAVATAEIPATARRAGPEHRSRPEPGRPNLHIVAPTINTRPPGKAILKGADRAMSSRRTLPSSL